MKLDKRKSKLFFDYEHRVKQCGKCKEIKDLRDYYLKNQGMDETRTSAYASNCKVCATNISKLRQLERKNNVH